MLVSGPPDSRRTVCVDDVDGFEFEAVATHTVTGAD